MAHIDYHSMLCTSRSLLHLATWVVEKVWEEVTGLRVDSVAMVDEGVVMAGMEEVELVVVKVEVEMVEAKVGEKEEGWEKDLVEVGRVVAVEEIVAAALYKHLKRNL